MTAPPGQWVAGIHAVKALLKHGAAGVEGVWFDARRKDRRLAELLRSVAALGVAQHPSERAELDRLSGGANHQGVLARAAMPAGTAETQLPELLAAIDGPPLVLVLDGVQDPHNLGACLRSADGAGAHLVIAPRDRSVGLTPTACKVACGAAETVPLVQVTNLARTLRWLQDEAGLWLIGTSDAATETLYDADLTGPLALVMGAEDKGLRRLTAEQCDQRVRLPMAGTVESLNVSVATGIALYEAVRQRREASRT